MKLSDRLKAWNNHFAAQGGEPLMRHDGHTLIGDLALAAVQVEQLSHAGAAIEMLTKEREEYRMRWLSCAQPGEADRLPSPNEER